MMVWTQFILEGIRHKKEYRTLPDSSQRNFFIGEHRLRKVWRNFYDQPSACHSDTPRDILHIKDWILEPLNEGRRTGESHGILIFMSILVSIGWNRWDLILSLFFDNGRLKFSDQQLPLHYRQTYLDLGDFEPTFVEIQYGFLPRYLYANQRISCSEWARLPFLEEYTPCNRRFQGQVLKVRKVKVARNYFVKTDGSGRKESYYARKDCEKAEAEIMERLRKGLMTPDRIAKIMCSIEQPNNFSILIDWADGDDLDYRLHTSESILQPLLRTQGGLMEGSDIQREIILEMANLVGAVDWLHSQRVDRVPCYHMDIKPGNILVYYDKYPEDIVGHWKIADFGLSVFHKRAVPATPGASKTPAKRPKGEFQPPEADDDWKDKPRGINSLGDIWSLGAILCLVLAYSLNGADGVKALDKKRRETALGGEAVDCFFYFLPPHGRTKPKLKSCIRHWLDQVVEEHHEIWVHEMVQLIRTCLKVDADDRPSAKNLYQDIYKVIEDKMVSPCPRRPSVQTIDLGDVIALPRQETPEVEVPALPITRDSQTPRSGRSISHRTRGSNASSQSPSQEPVRFTPIMEPLERISSTLPRISHFYSSSKKYKLALCPLQSYVLLLDSEETVILRPDQQYQAAVDKQDHILGIYSDAIVRWPYSVLILSSTGEAKFHLHDPEARGFSTNLESTYLGYAFSNNQVAINASGEVVVVATSKTLALHDPSEPARLDYNMPLKTHEVFQKVYFSLTDDVLLACGSKYFFVWVKLASTWRESWTIKKDPLYIGICPKTLAPNNLSGHVVIHFRRRRAFLVHNGAGFFGIFLRQDKIVSGEGTICKKILCGAITPDDRYVYYVRQHTTGHWQKRYSLSLYRRGIGDMQVHDEQEVGKLDGLTCAEKTTASMMIRQTSHSDDLVLFTSHNQFLTLPLNSSPHRQSVGDRSHVRTPSGPIGLGLFGAST